MRVSMSLARFGHSEPRRGSRLMPTASLRLGKVSGSKRSKLPLASEAWEGVQGPAAASHMQPVAGWSVAKWCSPVLTKNPHALRRNVCLSTSHRMVPVIKISMHLKASSEFAVTQNLQLLKSSYSEGIYLWPSKGR